MQMCKCSAELKYVWLSLSKLGLKTDGVVLMLLCVVEYRMEFEMSAIYEFKIYIHIFFFLVTDLNPLSSPLISVNLGEGWIDDNPSGNNESGECHSVLFGKKGRTSKCQTPQV